MLKTSLVIRSFRRSYDISSKALYASMRLTLNSRQIQYRLCSTATASTSESAKPKVEDDDYADFIDEISKERETELNVSHFVFDIVGLKNFTEIKQAFTKKRPSCAGEASAFMYAISSVLKKWEDPLKHDKQSVNQLRNWVLTEQFCSMLNAHILTDEATPDQLLTTLNSLYHIIGTDINPENNKRQEDRLSTAHRPPVSITPQMRDILTELTKRVEKVLCGDLNMEVKKLVLLHTRIRKDNISISPTFNSLLTQALMSKIKDAHDFSDLLSLFRYLDPTKTSAEVNPLLQKIEEQLPATNLGNLVAVLQCWVDKNHIKGNYTWRKHPVLDRIIEAIAKHDEDLTPQQIIKLTTLSRSFIGYEFVPLVPKIGMSFSLKWNEFKKWSEISPVAVFMSHFRVTYRQPWKCIIRWMYRNIEPLPPVQDVSIVYSACVLANCDKKLLGMIGSRLARHLDPMAYEDNFDGAMKWLNVVYTLSISDNLTSKLAHTVLNQDFAKFLMPQNPKNRDFESKSVEERSADFTRYFFVQKLIQLNFAAIHILGNAYNGPTLNPSQLILDDDLYVRMIGNKLKYTKDDIVLAKNFRTVLNVYCESEQLRLPPFLDVNSGVFIDALIYWDKTSQVPLNVKANHSGKNVDKVAILYFTDRHMTRIATGESDPNQIRLLGTYQFQIKLLEKSGYKVVVITERDMQNFGTTPGKHLEYIMNQIKEPSRKYIEDEKWGSVDDDEPIKREKKLPPKANSNVLSPKNLKPTYATTSAARSPVIKKFSPKPSTFDVQAAQAKIIMPSEAGFAAVKRGPPKQKTVSKRKTTKITNNIEDSATNNPDKSKDTNS